MKNNVLRSIVVVLAALVILAPMAEAKSKDGDCKSCKMKMGLDSKFFYKAHLVTENAKELGLSDKQVEDIRVLKSNVKKDSIKREAEIDAVGVDISDHLRKRPIDTEAVNALIDQKYELKKATAVQAVGALAQLKASLSDEQYKAMKNLKETKKGKDKSDRKR